MFKPSLLVPTIDQIPTNVTNVSLGAGNASIMKNRIINGAAVIDQRNNGGNIGNINGVVYSADRWVGLGTVVTKYTIQQNAGSVTPPNGFVNYVGVTSSTSYSVLAADRFYVYQGIEGYNIADLNWGSGTAKTVTLSFWVYSSLTGTFGGSLTNSVTAYSYPFSYSIGVSNTWTYVTVTIPGPTAGAWLTNNSVGIYLVLSLGVGSTYTGSDGSWSANNYLNATGSVSVVGTSGATFYFTGVQLEVGSAATGFEYRHQQQEFALCQRYYQIAGNTTNNSITIWGYSGAGGTYGQSFRHPVVMRAAPTGAIVGTWAVVNSSQPTIYASGPDSISVYGTATALAAASTANSTASSQYITLTAEY